jgi:hypothetical protein
VWCFKQAFIPVAIIPICLTMTIIAIINLCFVKIVGNGDIFLFLISGFFVQVNRLNTFVILCGLIGVCTCIAMRSKIIPFSFAILLSMIITFCLDLIMY